jgi:hypothetical protein
MLHNGGDMSIWIPTKYALPEDGQYVLIYPVYISSVFKDEPRHVLRFHDGVWKYYLGDSVHGIAGHEVTHWMPLPRNP